MGSPTGIAAPDVAVTPGSGEKHPPDRTTPKWRGGSGGGRRGGVLSRLVKGGVSVGLVVFLVITIGWHPIVEVLGRVHWGWLALMLAVSGIVRVLGAVQFRTVLEWQGVPISLRRVMLANAQAAAYSLVLPDVVSAGVRWANLSAATRQRAVVLASIVYTRLMLTLPPLVLGALALAIENPFGSLWVTAASATVALLGLAGTIWLYHPRHGLLFNRIVHRVMRPFPARISDRVDALLAPLAALRNFGVAGHLNVVGVSVAIFVLSALTLYLGLLALGVQLPLLVAVWAFAVINVLRQIPITVNNFGIREGALIVMLRSHDVVPEVILAYGVLVLATHVLTAVVGMGYQFALGMGWARWHEEPRDPLVPTAPVMPPAGDG